MLNCDGLGELKQTIKMNGEVFEIFENNRQMFNEIGFALKINGGLIMTPSGRWYTSIQEAITAIKTIKLR